MNIRRNVVFAFENNKKIKKAITKISNFKFYFTKDY